MKDEPPPKSVPYRQIALESAISATFLWLAQPPVEFWPLAFVALVPLIRLATLQAPISKRGYAIVWAFASAYWLVSLQGLRHAHWAMYFCWIALACYLATYHVLFLVSARAMLSRARIPLFLVVAVAWTGQECIRNYMLTGISACMLGHSVAEIPALTQIADLFGSYGVSFVIAACNAAVFQLVLSALQRKRVDGLSLDLAAASVLLGATLLYGQLALQRPLGEPIGAFALVQRSEPVEYEQAKGREVEMFRTYTTDSISAIRETSEKIDAIVWPESMFTAGNPWMIADPDAAAPPAIGIEGSSLSAEDLQRGVAESRDFFLQRASYLLNAINIERPGVPPPHLIVGCGVVHYRQQPEVFSGVVSIRPDGSVEDWYGKTHLVMFGEYVPVISHIPGLRALVPPGLGLQAGAGAKTFRVNDATVSANICIETAVERVTINQMRSLLSSDSLTESLPDAIVTVTNDGWFDDSSVIDHHRRCAQFVAIGCRRPILSAANNGPTAWIDSRGVVVEDLPTGTEGVLIAKPRRNEQISLYVRIGDWPARLCAAACVLPIGMMWYRRRKEKAAVDS